jgi:hypothetical protein
MQALAHGMIAADGAIMGEIQRGSAGRRSAHAIAL